MIIIKNDGEKKNVIVVEQVFNNWVVYKKVKSIIKISKYLY